MSRKLLSTLLVLSLSLFLVPPVTQAKQLEGYSANLPVYITSRPLDNYQVTFTENPVIANYVGENYERVFLQLTPIAKALEFNVTYNEELKRTELTPTGKEEWKTSCAVPKAFNGDHPTSIYINGVQVKANMPVQAKNGQMMVDLDTLLEMFGSKAHITVNGDSYNNVHIKFMCDYTTEFKDRITFEFLEQSREQILENYEHQKREYTEKWNKVMNVCLYEPITLIREYACSEIIKLKTPSELFPF